MNEDETSSDSAVILSIYKDEEDDIDYSSLFVPENTDDLTDEEEMILESIERRNYRTRKL